MVGIGSGAMIMPSLAQQLIARFGWREAYAILAAEFCSLPFRSIGCFSEEKPQDLGLLRRRSRTKNSRIVNAGLPRRGSAQRMPGALELFGSWWRIFLGKRERARLRGSSRSHA